MREHAIPQDVTGYRFHIIGNMTLKQFAEVGAGVIIGVLIYTTNLPSIIKWPFICIAVGMGALAAFVPFEERPFDHWLVTFARVLYKPTKYYWKRQSKIPDPFLYEPGTPTNALSHELDLGPARRDRVKEYLTSVEPEDQLNQFDILEQNRLYDVLGAFSTVQTQVGHANKAAQKPDLKVRVRAMKPQAGEFELDLNRHRPSQAPAEVTIMPDQETSVLRPGLQVGQVAQDITIPEVQPVAIEGNGVTEEDAQYQTAVETPERAFVEAAPVLPIEQTVNQAAAINLDLPFPDPPTEPNKLVGMVLSPDNSLINDAIVEISDATGRVARAVKTNALGQFFITTPLESGQYIITVEHGGYQFSPLSLELVGQAVPPIEIRSMT